MNQAKHEDYVHVANKSNDADKVTDTSMTRSTGKYKMCLVLALMKQHLILHDVHL